MIAISRLSQHDVTFPGWQSVHMKMSNCSTRTTGLISSLKSHSGKIAVLGSRGRGSISCLGKEGILVRRV